MTRGEHIAQNVRDYLTTSGITQSKLTGKLLAEIADRTLAHLEKLAAKKKRLATEEEWLNEQQADPAMAGLDVRAMLADAQFWCRNNTRVCSRKFFTNWLLNPKNRKILNGGGHAPKKANGHAPSGWLDILRRLHPDSPVCDPDHPIGIKVETDYAWSQLPQSTRDEIRNAL